MNIYLFELKAQIRTFVIWTAILIGLLTALMAGMYPIFYDTMDEVVALLKGFPPQFAAAFGIHMENLFSFGGFFSFTFSYLALVAAIMTAVLAVSTFAREKRSKCTDFLLTKPLTREKIFLAKFLAILTVIAAANLLVLGASAVIYLAGGQEADLLGRILLAVCGLFFTQLVFLAMGTLFAISAKKVRSVSGAATAFGFTGFILSALHGILEKEAMRFIAPLKYFDPSEVIFNGSYEVKYVITAVVVIAFCISVSWIRYCKTDAHAV